MGYTTYVTGQFTISPPLTWGEFKDSPLVSPDWRASDLCLRVEEEIVHTDEGQLIRKTASVLEMREIDEYRADKLLNEVESAVLAFPGHEFTGRLDCRGERSPDMWRVVIRDRKAVRVDPQIVWPDDAE